MVKKEESASIYLIRICWLSLKMVLPVYVHTLVNASTSGKTSVGFIQVKNKEVVTGSVNVVFVSFIPNWIKVVSLNYVEHQVAVSVSSLVNIAIC